MGMNPRKGTVTCIGSGACRSPSLRQVGMNPRKGTVTLHYGCRQVCPATLSGGNESSEGDCDPVYLHGYHRLIEGQVGMNPRKGTVTRRDPSTPQRGRACQVGMNPRKGTVTTSRSRVSDSLWFRQVGMNPRKGTVTVRIHSHPD